MTGAIINAAGIVVGGVWGLAAKKPIQPSSQLALKIGLGRKADVSAPAKGAEKPDQADTNPGPRYPASRWAKPKA